MGKSPIYKLLPKCIEPVEEYGSLPEHLASETLWVHKENKTKTEVIPQMYNHLLTFQKFSCFFPFRRPTEEC